MSNNIFFTEQNGLFTIPIPEENFTVNDANSEFTDGFFVAWSYPLSIFLNASLKRTLGDLTRPTLSKRKKEIAGILSKYGEIFPCKMQIISTQNSEAKINFEFGVASIDVMSKKLSEIDLGTIVTGNLYNYIDAHLFETYPVSPVCFPRIHTPYNYADEIGNLYGGRNVFNDSNSSGGICKILRNEFADSGQAIFTFIKPIVYLLHILKKGFASSGYILKGDILTDMELQNVGFNHNNTADVELLQDIKRLPYNTHLAIAGVIEQTFDVLGHYYFSLILDNDDSSINMKVVNVATSEVLYENTKSGQYVEYDQYGERINVPYSLEYIYLLDNFSVTTKLKIILTVSNYNGSVNPSGELFIAYLNPAGGGNSKKAYVLPDSLVLNKYVPDTNFIDVVKSIKGLENYSFVVSNNEIYMNKIKNTLPAKVIDFKFSEQEDVEITSSDVKGFLLKYTAPEEFGFLDYQYDENGFVKMELKIENDELQMREIAAYPLPFTLNLIDGNSVDQLKEEAEGLPMIRYTGLLANNNAVPLSSFSLENIYINYYKNWMFGRLTSGNFKWNFSTKKPDAIKVKSTDCISAYGAFHKIKNVSKKYHQNNIIEISFETENRY